MKKWWSTIVVVVILLLGLFLIVRGFLTSLTSSHAARAVAQLRQELVPILEAPEDFDLRLSDSSDKLPPPIRASQRDLADRWHAVLEQFEQRHLGMRDQFDEVILVPMNLGFEDLTDARIEELAEYIRTDTDLLDEIRDLSRYGPIDCPDYSYKHWHSYVFADLALSGSVMLSVTQQDYKGAVRDLLALCRIAKPEEHVVYPFMMGGKTPRVIAWALADGGVPDELWDEFLDHTVVDQLHDAFVRGLARETATWLDWYDDLPRNEPRGVRESNRLLERGAYHALAWGYCYAATPLKNRYQTIYGEGMKDILAMAPEPYYAIQSRLHAIRECYDLPEDLRLPFLRREPGQAQLTYLTVQVFRDQALAEAAMQMARYAVLLQKFQHVHGAYPERLDLVMDGNGAATINPLLGEPFIYQAFEEGFKLGFRYQAAPSTSRNDTNILPAIIWPNENEEAGPPAP